MMTSALYAPHVAVVSPNHMASEYSVMKEKFHAAQAHGGYVDKYLAKLMYCRPISDSESLPEKTVREKMRTIYSDKVTSSIADSAPRNDSSKELSSGLQQVEINDRTIPTLPARDAGISNETEEKSKPHPPKCECGCIPKIPSLFEMAELRRQHRERIKNSGKS